MNADGSGLSKLTDWESHEEVGPGCWSMDGTKIALISNRSGNEDIYVMNVEPFRPQLLLTDEDANISAASYSPDGTQLIYQAELPDKSGELRIRDVQSGKVNTLKKTANANLRPAWSPDGKVITFQDKVGGSTALYRIEPGGNELAKITDNSTTDIEPAWSPNGIHVAFVADNFGRSRLYTIDTVTGKQNALTSKDGWESDPVWSPDGSRIAFACDREDLPGNGFDICLMDADGQNEARLLSRRGHDIQPAWSPDGSRFAFVGTSDGNSEVYVMNSDGSGVLRLTRHLAEDLAPHWSPDGTRIIFTSNRIGKSAIYEITL
jgi:Tol biopolymer transport system component